MWESWLDFAITTAICLAVASAVIIAVAIGMRITARRQSWATELSRRVRRPFRTLVLLLALWTAVAIALPVDDELRGAITRLAGIITIGVTAWLLVSLVLFATDLMLGRFRVDVPDNRAARRIRTQTLILRRLAIAIIIVIAIASTLLTFPAVQTLGASLLASAGIASIVAGLAAQSVLSNMFAGVQLVFSDALRVDDVLVVGGEWGRVGEITLSYVVLDVWDQRRLILPCTHFTTQPFENWTRRGSELLGSVEIDLDWRVPVDRVRERLGEILASTDLWDGRTSVVQITDATGGLVRLRILVSAADSGKLFDLRCVVREELVGYLQETEPTALPLQRVLMSGAEDPAARRDTARDGSAAAGRTATATERAGLFSGTEEAEQRHEMFTQAIPLPPSSDEDEDVDDGSQRSTS